MIEIPQLPEINEIPDDQWSTYNGHPASGLRYQESTAGPQTAARVIQDGHEVVSPSVDLNAVYRQFNGRVQRWIEDAERQHS